MRMTQYEELIIKVIYTVLAGMIIFQAFGLNVLVSRLFYVTFLLVFLIWLSTLRKIKRTDILCLAVITISTANVLISVLVTDSEISVTFFNKLIIFIMTIIYFQTLNKAYINLSTKEFIYKIINGLCVFLIFLYIFRNNEMHMLNGLVTKYLTFGFTNPNLTGMFIVCVAMFQIIQMKETNKKINRFFHLFLSVSMCFFLVKTRARNCLLGFALFLTMCVCVLVTKKKEYRIGHMVATLISVWPLLFSLLYLLFVNSRVINNMFTFMVSEGKALSSRVSIWTEAISIIKDNPLIGAYSLIGFKSQMHNSHLDIWISYGAVTLILVCVFLKKVILNNVKNCTEHNDIMYACAFIVTIIIGMGEAAMFSGGLGIYLLMGMFLIKCPEKQ